MDDPLIPKVGRRCVVTSSTWEGERPGTVVKAADNAGPDSPVTIEIDLDPARDETLIKSVGEPVLHLQDHVVHHPEIRKTMPADRPWAFASWPREDFAPAKE